MTLNLDKIDLGGFGINQEDPVDETRTSVDDIIDTTAVAPAGQRVKSTVSQALQVNPDQQAQMNKLSRDSGMPVPAVESDPAAVETHLNLNKINFDEMSKRSPTTSKFLTDYNNAAVAHDDIEVLQVVENHVRGFGQGALDFPAMGTGGLGRSIESINRLFGRGLDALLPESADKYIWRQTDTPAALESINKLLDVGGAAQSTGAVLKDVAENIGPDETGFTTDVARGLGQLAGQIATYIASPHTALPLLFGQGADIQGSKQDETGATGTSASADLAVLLGGAITAGTERVQIDTFIKRLPPEIKNRFLKQLADVAIAGSAEAVQEVVEGVSQNILELYTTNPDAEILEGAAYEGAVAGTTGAIAQTLINLVDTALPGKVRSAQGDIASQELQSDIDQRDIDQLNESTSNSKLRDRDADSFKQFVQESDGENNTTIFIDGAQASLYLAEKTQEEIATDPALQLLAVQVDESQSLGVDVQIPVGDFAT